MNKHNIYFLIIILILSICSCKTTAWTAKISTEQIKVESDVIPEASGTVSLGSATKYFSNVYANEGHFSEGTVYIGPYVSIKGLGRGIQFFDNESGLIELVSLNLNTVSFSRGGTLDTGTYSKLVGNYEFEYDVVIKNVYIMCKTAPSGSDFVLNISASGGNNINVSLTDGSRFSYSDTYLVIPQDETMDIDCTQSSVGDLTVILGLGQYSELADTPTTTPTNTPTETPTNTAISTPTIGGFTNGDFETGDLTGWTTLSGVYGGDVYASNYEVLNNILNPTAVRSGSYGAFVEGNFYCLYQLIKTTNIAQEVVIWARCNDMMSSIRLGISNTSNEPWDVLNFDEYHNQSGDLGGTWTQMSSTSSYDIDTNVYVSLQGQAFSPWNFDDITVTESAPTNTPTETPTNTVTETPTETATATPTETATATPTEHTLTNGNFETGDLTGWETDDFTIDTMTVHGGSYAAMTDPNTTNCTLLQRNVVEAGSTQYLTVWISSGNDASRIGLEVTTGTTPSYDWTNIESAATWTQVSRTVMYPESTAVNIYVQVEQAGNGMVYNWVDDITYTSD